MGLTNRGALCYNLRKYGLNRRGHARSRAQGQGTLIRRTVVTKETAVLRSLDEGEERSADDIYESVRQALGYSAGIREITTTLLMLSMRGIIREESPGRYTVGGILEA